MGRASRTKRLRAAAPPQERRIPLERGSYFELAALTDRARKIELEAQATIAGLRARIDTLMQGLGKAHGFDPNGTFRLEDKDCALIVPIAPEGGK